MRRIVIVVALVAVVGVAAFLLLRPKNAPKKGADKTTSDTSEVADSEAAKTSRRKGRTAGRVRPKSKAEIRAERKKLRKEERRRKKEQKRREREQRRMLKQAGRRRSKRSKRGSKGRSYVVRAIVYLGADSYALIDGRRVGVGDVIMGRRVVSVEPDRIQIESFGRMTSVRVGESIMPLTFDTKRRRG